MSSTRCFKTQSGTGQPQDFPLQGGDLSISALENVEIVNISEGLDNLNRDNNEYYDIVISTYIGYWALSDDENEEIYRNLLTTLIDKKKTKLITVDARDPEFCVLARPPNHIGWENLNEFYESLRMGKKDMFWNQKTTQTVTAKLHVSCGWGR